MGYWFDVSPNDAFVAYAATQETDGVAELYLTTPLGGTPVKISSPILHPAGNVEFLQFSPNSQMLVYWADSEHDWKYELYTVFDGWGAFLPTVKK